MIIHTKDKHASFVNNCRVVVSGEGRSSSGERSESTGKLDFYLYLAFKHLIQTDLNLSSYYYS